MESKEAYVKRRFVIAGIIARILLLVVPALLYTALPVPGFRPDQFEILLCLVMPLTSLYLIFFVKFILQNRYQREGQVLEAGYVNIGYFLLLILNAGELAIVVWKGFDNTIFEDNNFFFLIAVFESGWGIFAGFYLSQLFGRINRIAN